MGALAKITAGVKHVDLRHKSGLLHHGVETAEYIGASYALGRIHGHYRDRAKLKNIPLNLLVGVGGKFLAVVGDAFGLPATHHLNTVANAGLGSYFHALGVAHGTQSSGRKVYVLPPGAPAPAGLPAGTETVLGDLGKAPRGRYLSRDEINELARMR